MKRKWLYLLVCTTLMASTVFTGTSWAAERSGYDNEINSKMTIHFIDVGEGDSTLIDFGEYEILIDAGPNMAGQAVVDYIKPYVDGSLDLVIATHVHHDHIGGMDDVLKAYDVKEIIHSGDTYHTQSYLDYYAAVQAKPNCLYTEDEDRIIDMGGGAVLRIIDGIDHSQNYNNNSVIAELTYGETKVLFVGDLEESGELLYLNRLEPVNVLKVGHHGSATSSGTDFLAVLKPEVGIVSAGYANEGLHPHIRAMRRLFEAGTNLYGTFKSGTIVMTLDGTSYSLNVNETLQYADAGQYHVIREFEGEVWR